MTDDPGEQTTLDANLPEAPHAVHGAECRRRLWQACARATGNRTVAPRRSLRRGRHRDCGRFRCTAPAHHVSLRRTGTGGRLDCRRRAALCLRSLTRTPTLVGGGIRTAAHLYAPPVLWLAAMQAGAWFEWQVRRTPIAYGTNWFYAEMYNEYVREPSGLVLSASVAAAVTASLAAVLGAWIACACLSLRKNAAPRRGRLSNDNRARFSISEHSCLRGPSFTDSIGSPRTRATARYLPASCITFLSEQAFAPQNTRFWSRSRVWFQFTVGEDKPPMLSVHNRGKGVLSMDCSAKRSPL